MATDTGYAKRDFLRVCDICGHRFHMSQLKPIGELKFACADDFPGLTSLQISRYNARARPLVVRPNRHAKLISQTPIYQGDEATIFNFIASTAPVETVSGVATAMGAAWSAIYMADVVTQDKRPLKWMATARTVISTCCTYLLTRQFGSPSGFSPSGAVTDPRYGGITDGTATSGPSSTATWTTAKTIAAGLAFIKSYSATANPAYLAAADRCATFIRHVQSANLQVTNYTVYPTGGGRYRIGGLASGVADNNGVLSANYYLADVAAAWFLALLGEVRGMSTVYGDAAATASFIAPTTGTITEIIAELTTFATSGVRDSTNGGELTTGLSTTAPRTLYVAATTSGGDAAWDPTTTIESDDISLALVGLYMANGANDKVTEMVDWLGAFASNVNNRTLATTPESRVLTSITGTYDPTLCPADTLKAAAPFTEADGALYSWSSLGLLSPIYAARSPGLRRSKDQLGVPQRYSALNNYEKYLGPLGSSGLSLQPVLGATDSAAATTGPVPGMWAWFKADVGVTESPPGYALAWADQSGNGHHTTSPVQPEYTVGAINGLPVIGFGGFQARLENTTDNFPGAGTRTIMSVVRPFDLIGGTMLSFRRGTTDWAAYLYFLLGTQFLWSDGLANIPRNGTAVDYSGVVHLVEHIEVAHTLTVKVDGTDVPLLTTTTTTEGGTTGFIIGNREPGGYSQHFYGQMGETLWYDFALTAAQRAQNVAYLSERWGLSVAPADAVATSVTGQSVVKAAKTGMIYRQAPGHYPHLRG